MIFQESDIESYQFHENGMSGGKPVYSMFRGTSENMIGGGSGSGSGGTVKKHLVVPIGVIVEQSASEECMRSLETGNKWICKKEAGYLGNDVFDKFLEQINHGITPSKKHKTRKQKQNILMKK
jgi:hypothetical protein